MAGEKKMVTRNQLLKIKGNALNKNNIFSRLTEFSELMDDSNECEDLCKNLSSNLKLKNEDEKFANHMHLKSRSEKKKEIRDNIFAIRSQSSAIKNLNYKLADDKLKPCPNPFHSGQSKSKESTNSRLNLSKFLSDFKKTENLTIFSKLTSKKMENRPLFSKLANKKTPNRPSFSKFPVNAKKILRSNHDLYAEKISKQLKESDPNLIKFIIDIIGPNLSFKLSSQVCKQETSQNLNYDISDEEEDDKQKPIEIFMDLIRKEKRIPFNSKQLILDYKFKYYSNKMTKNKKIKMVKTVDTDQCVMDNLYLSLDGLNITINNDKKVPKKIDFK